MACLLSWRGAQFHARGAEPHPELHRSRTLSSSLRVVAAADSLGLPRRVPSPVGFEQVWPTLLERLLQDLGVPARVFNHAQRSMTLPMLVHRFDDVVGLWGADVVVLQVGIVDCAPRLFGRRQHAVLSSRFFPTAIRRAVIGTASRFRRQIIRLRPWVRYTPLPDFERALGRLANRLRQETFRGVVLPIIGTTPDHEHRSPGYNRSVELFNAAWRQMCAAEGIRFLEYRDVFLGTDVRDVVCSDGHHLSIQGHQLVAAALARVIASHKGGQV